MMIVIYYQVKDINCFLFYSFLFWWDLNTYLIWWQYIFLVDITKMGYFIIPTHFFYRYDTYSIGTIMCDISTINVRFYLLEVSYRQQHYRITQLKLIPYWINVLEIIISTSERIRMSNEYMDLLNPSTY